MLRFKIDENLPVEAADLLRDHGHDAATVLEQRMGGEIDSTLATACRREERAIITLDLDFSDIRNYPPDQYAGLVVLRLDRQDKPHILEVMRRLQPRLNQEPLKGRLWVVDEDSIRIRGDDPG